jgi:hypothetical protein
LPILDVLSSPNSNANKHPGAIPNKTTIALMLRTILASLAILLLLFSTLKICAQNAKNAEPTREQLQIQISILLDRIKALEAANGQAAAQPIQTTSIDPRLQQAYVEAQEKQYQYITKLMDVNIQTFDVQWWSSYAILFLVIVVVLSGVSFSGFQLWKSISVAGVQPTTELEV